MSSQQQRLRQLGQVLLQHRGIVVALERCVREAVCDPTLSHLLEEEVHAVLAPRPPEDALVTEEGLDMGDELNEDYLALGRDGGTQFEGGCGVLTVWAERGDTYMFAYRSS